MDLPPELWNEIFLALEFSDIISVACVSNALRSVVTSDTFVNMWWRNHDTRSYNLYHVYRYKDRPLLPHKHRVYDVLRYEYMATCRIRSAVRSVLHETNPIRVFFDKTISYIAHAPYEMAYAMSDVVDNSQRNHYLVRGLYRKFTFAGSGLHMDIWAIVHMVRPLCERIYETTKLMIPSTAMWENNVMMWFFVGLMLTRASVADTVIEKNQVAMLDWIIHKSQYLQYHRLVYPTEVEAAVNTDARTLRTWGLEAEFQRFHQRFPVSIAYGAPYAPLGVFLALVRATPGAVSYLEDTPDVIRTDYRNWPKVQCLLSTGRMHIGGASSARDLLAAMQTMLRSDDRYEPSFLESRTQLACAVLLALADGARSSIVLDCWSMLNQRRWPGYCMVEAILILAITQPEVFELIWRDSGVQSGKRTHDQLDAGPIWLSVLIAEYTTWHISHQPRLANMLIHARYSIRQYRKHFSDADCWESYLPTQGVQRDSPRYHHGTIAPILGHLIHTVL